MRRNMIVLDGGMGHLLRRMGVQISGAFGSSERFLGVALANTTQPEVVERAHAMYIESGATVITTNSYACVPRCLGIAEENGVIERSKLLLHIRAAGERAARARDMAKNPNVRVAGCIPPLGPSYRADLVGEAEELKSDYKFIAESIAPFCDVLLCETMASVREGKAAAAAAAATGLPVWLSWTLSDESHGQLRSGECLSLAASVSAECKGVEAVLVNCQSVDATSAAIPTLRRALPDSIAVGAYANGMVVHVDTSKTDSNSGAPAIQDEYVEALTPETYADAVAGWVRDGASIVGGCCGVFPEHISAVAERFASE